MKSERHLNYIRSLPCVICGDNVSVQAAHVRMSDARIAKPESGMQRKPSDAFCLPVCGMHHDAQHRTSERRYWAQYRIDAVLTSLALFEVSGNYERGCEIVAAARSR